MHALTRSALLALVPLTDWLAPAGAAGRSAATYEARLADWRRHQVDIRYKRVP